MKAASLSYQSIRTQLICVSLLFFLPLARGQITFFNPPSYADSGTAYPLIVADFNRDGIPDLLAPAADGGYLQLGEGNGRVASPIDTPSYVAVADFNGDGIPDLLQKETGAVMVLLGNGDGTFQKPISSNTGTGYLLNIVTADLRGDGDLDVLAISLSTDDLVVLLGNGSGSFAPAVNYSVPLPVDTSITQLVVGDFNGDKKPDVAVIEEGIGTGQVLIFLGNGDGTLQLAITSAGGPASSGVAADFNGDGKLDLALNDGLVLLGDGDGTFQAPITAFSGGHALATGDLNGDGKADLVVVPSDNSSIQILLGNGDGTFTSPYTYELSTYSNYSSGPVVADFNLDGKLDIAVGGQILLGNGNGSFQGWPAILDAGNLAATGDFDKNGTQDVATAGDGIVSILLNAGTGVFTLAHTYSLEQPSASMAVGDLNGDGKLDLVVAGYSLNLGGSYTVLLGNGDGSFQPPVFYPLGVGYNSLQTIIADFNNDKIPDLAISASEDDGVAVLLGNGDGTFGAPTYVFDGGGPGLAAADFNGDGKLDLASGGSGAGLAILLGNGDGTFQTAAFSFPALYNLCCTADINGDGKADLVGTGPFQSGPIQILLGNGDGTFKALSPFQGLNGGYGAMAISDINGDGVPDLVAAHSNNLGGGSAGVFLGNGDGTFESFLDVYNFGPNPSIPSFVAVADMNADGKPDLVLNGAGSVFVLLNTTGAGFMLAATAPSPATVMAGSSATTTISITSNLGFSQTVFLACSSITLNGSAATTAPPTCSFSPTSIMNGKGISSLTIRTSASSVMLSPAAKHPSGFYYVMLMPFFGLSITAGIGLKRKKMMGVAACVTIAALLFLPGCGGGRNAGGSSGSGAGGGGGGGAAATPAGNYTITVTGTSGSIMSSTMVMLTVQ